MTMRCEACRLLLDDFVDQELPETERHNIEQHLHECSECHQEAESLQNLSRTVATLPKNIQPDSDLWPRIQAALTTEPSWESDLSEMERQGNRPRTASGRWLIAAAALIATFVLAGIYFVSMKHAGGNSNNEATPIASDRQSSGDTQSRSIPLFDMRSGSAVGYSAGTLRNSRVRTVSDQWTGGLMTYTMDPIAGVFVSNYGIYAVRQDWDPPSFEVTRNYILRFDQNGTTISWIPPLPLGSILTSVYPGPGNRLWASYYVREPEFEVAIVELDFGTNSYIKNVWKSHEEFQIFRLVIGPQGLIYMAGYRADLVKDPAKISNAQSLSAELLHIVDPLTGEEQHIFPITFRPKFNSQPWMGNMMLEMIDLAARTTIAVKSNGNFLVTIDQTSPLKSSQNPIKNEAVEYSTNGTVVKTWQLGTLESNTYLNRIFVDADDSIIAEITSSPNVGTADSTLRIVGNRHLLRIDFNGRAIRHELALSPYETIQGWSGQMRELVTLIRGAKPEIRIHRLPF